MVGGQVLRTEQPGNAKIRQLDAPLFTKEQVGRLQIPVDDPPVVGMLEGLADIDCVVDRLAPGTGPL